MKNHRFLQTLAILVLLVTAVSCTAIREGEGYYEFDERSRGNTYYGQSSRSYGNDVIVVERDPFTGRYYQVSPYGYGTTYPYNNNRYYGNGYYNRGTNNRANGRSYRGGYNTQPNTGNQQTGEQRQQKKEELNRAKSQIFGPKKN